MKRAILIIILFSALLLLSSATIWQDRNIYSSTNQLAVGDIIIVHINDAGSMEFELTVKSNSNNSVTTNPDVTITAFLPKISSTKSLSANDSTDFSSKTNMAFTVAARITARVAGNKYRVQAVRTYAVNGVIQRLTVTGTVDPVLLDGRKINSNTMSDFRMQIQGTKEMFQINRPALQGDDKADAKLTEAEKQRIIIDYLQKMLGELTR